MDKEKEIILDIIPIFIDEIYPTEDEWWHFKAEIKTGTDREYLLNEMLREIKYKFQDYSAVIVLEKGRVIDVIR